MPLRTKKDRAKYMKRYREFREKQRKALERALRNGDLGKARKALAKKPDIHIRKRRRKK